MLFVSFDTSTNFDAVFLILLDLNSVNSLFLPIYQWEGRVT